jgi:hypothetical protein
MAMDLNPSPFLIEAILISFYTEGRHAAFNFYIYFVGSISKARSFISVITYFFKSFEIAG